MGARVDPVDAPPDARPRVALEAVEHGGATFDRVREAAAGCQACDLWARATQTVFGAGPVPARLMLVGEQPGDKEDLAGEPFVGPAGGMLARGLEEGGGGRRGPRRWRGARAGAGSSPGWRWASPGRSASSGQGRRARWGGG